jgi:hypothetical protein
VGGSNKRPHKEKDKPELVLNAALVLILFLDQSPLVGSAVHFLMERPWKDCVLLYCVEDKLESALREVPLVLTEKDLATTALNYRHYTGDQDSNTVEQLTRLIVGLHPPFTTDFTNRRQQGIISFGDTYKESFRSGEHDIHKIMDRLSLYDNSKSPLEPIRDDWVDYFAAKVRRGHGPGWQDEPKLWLQIALVYWILVGECSVLEMKESCTVLPCQLICGFY